MMEKTISGIVFDIQRFSIHDGPGIRTTAFLKGCPLECVWCHNPESIEQDPEISYIEASCTLCGRCVDACPRGCHLIVKEKHRFRRRNCTRCGKCVNVCTTGAMETIGKTMTVEQVMEEVAKDLPFYETSGGGMTLSGGEPLMQYRFSRELLRAGRQNCIHNCLETNGYAQSGRLMELVELVDLFLFDFKESDPEKHRRFTGFPLEKISENLRLLDSAGASIILRCPIIPGLNDRADHFRAIAETAEKFKGIQEINLMPYHPLGRAKSTRIGKVFPIKKRTLPSEEDIENWLELTGSYCKLPVTQG